MQIFPTAITNLLGKAEAWDGNDVRKTNKQKKAGGGWNSFLCVSRYRKK